MQNLQGCINRWLSIIISSDFYSHFISIKNLFKKGKIQTLSTKKYTNLYAIQIKIIVIKKLRYSTYLYVT